MRNTAILASPCFCITKTSASGSLYDDLWRSGSQNLNTIIVTWSCLRGSKNKFRLNGGDFSDFRENSRHKHLKQTMDDTPNVTPKVCRNRVASSTYRWNIGSAAPTSALALTAPLYLVPAGRLAVSYQWDDHLGVYPHGCRYFKNPPKSIDCLISIYIVGLVVEPPLWKIWKSVGVTIPNILKNKNVPNHQPVVLLPMHNPISSSTIATL